ncbi:helix-turn-helix transcriptional regulator [Neisseriaceae bacterium ESL0693]|nr:helix-turn-helix transcriptional regulator [Neisseriaceae bacterium ESL0693]
MENFNVGFSQRIREVVEILGSISTLSKIVDVAYPTAAKWVKDGAEPSTTNLINIANAAGVHLVWLATGEGAKLKNTNNEVSNTSIKALEPPPTTNDKININDFVFIPRYDLDALPIHGGDAKPPLFHVAFRKYWIDNFIAANPEDLSVTSIKGDSMQGLLNDGDVILVNHSQNKPEDGIYVLRVGKNFLVKRTQVLPEGKLLVKPTNKEYESFTLDLKNENVAIVGKVEWFGRRI